MIGSVVGNYKIIDKIGEGGMGAVFKGVDLMLEREVAIKMLRPELARQPNIVERFRTEAVTLAKLNHSNIATLHSFFRQGDDFFMVMEFVRGDTLDTVIKRSGAMPCGHAVQLFCTALEGIDHAHRMGIVHRDIKPANMMLTDTGSIKVMDFGIARVLGTDRLTKTGHLIGTVEYMSPEQVRGEETDARSDIYSLGILLYEMLTGRVPFNSTSEYELMRCQIEEAPTPPRTFAPQIPLPVEQAIMRSLAKNREARYQSAGEFRDMLSQHTGALAGPGPAASVNVNRPTDPLVSGHREVMKDTRLASGSAPPAIAAAGQMNETRLAGDSIAPTRYQHQEAQQYTAQPQAAASLLTRLSWKHYAGAGAVLVALITVSLAVILSGGGSNPTQPAVGQPSTQSTNPSPAAAPNTSTTSQPSSSVPKQPPPPPDETKSAPAAQSSERRSPQSPATSAAGRTEPQRESGTPAERRGTQSEEANATAAKRTDAASGKKTKSERVGEAVESVGGAVKKIGGLFGKKKNK